MITPVENSEAEKSPRVKEMKKNWPRKSDKRSWFGQTPSTSLASAEDLEHLKTLLSQILPLPLRWSNCTGIKNVLQCVAFPGKS